MQTTVESKTIVLGLGQLQATQDPAAVLVCLGLGSCVAVCAHDPVSKTAGMAHLVLPSFDDGRRPGTEGRFVDTGIPMLIEQMTKLGATPGRIVAKIVGGAQMIPAPGNSNLAIGDRNVDAARAVLRRLGLIVRSADTGGNRGRTVKLYTDSGRLTVSTVGGTIRDL